MFYQAVKNLSQKAKASVDAKVHTFATRARRLMWGSVFALSGLVAVLGASLYVAIDTVMPHVHNIYSAAKLVDGEARGETRRGQKAVFATILVRMEDKRFPDTFHGVVYQPYSKNAKLLQYNAMGDEHHENLATDTGQQILWRTALWYVEQRLGVFQAPKEARGAHSYCTPVACERQVGYFGRLVKVGQIGNHVFYGDVEQADIRIADNLAPQTSPRPMPRPTQTCNAQESLAPCTSIRPMPRPQFPSLDEQSVKEIEAAVMAAAE